MTEQQQQQQQQQPEKLGAVGALICFAIIIGLGAWMWSCMSSLGEVEDCTGKATPQDTFECLKARDLDANGTHTRLYLEAVTAAGVDVFSCPQAGVGKIDWIAAHTDTHYQGRILMKCENGDWYRAKAEVSIKDGKIQNLTVEKGPFK